MCDYVVILHKYAILNNCDDGPQRKKHQVAEDLQVMKSDIELIKTFTRDPTTKIPLALQQETFRCTICYIIPKRDL